MADVAELQAELQEYKNARSKILAGGQSFGVDGMQREQARLDHLDSRIAEYERRIAIAKNGCRLPTGSVIFGGRRG